MADEANLAGLCMQLLQQLDRHRFAHVDGEEPEATDVDGRRVTGGAHRLVGRYLAGREEFTVTQCLGAAQRLAGGVHQQATHEDRPQAGLLRFAFRGLDRPPSGTCRGLRDAPGCAHCAA